MNVKRYSPILVENSWFGTSVSVIENKEGQYVHIDDYMHLRGVIRKMRGQIEKKNRRSRKFKEDSDFGKSR